MSGIPLRSLVDLAAAALLGRRHGARGLRVGAELRDGGLGARDLEGADTLPVDGRRGGRQRGGQQDGEQSPGVHGFTLSAGRRGCGTIAR